MSKISNFIFLIVTLLIGLIIGIIFNDKITVATKFFQRLWVENQLISPLADSLGASLPLEKYTIPSLVNYRFKSSQIVLTDLVEENQDFTTYGFYYTSMDKKITGVVNIPTNLDPEFLNFPVVLLLRGYVPPEIYESGVGTKNAASVFARNGYVTIAPDFLGYGGSDPEPEDTWEARLLKPINVIELINSVEEFGIPSGLDEIEATATTSILKPTSLQIWAHSNGGQIALTALEVSQRSIPTTLWAPVTAPFPYSVLFYSDENADEGKEARAWVAMFEKNYNALDFSLTQHLHLLNAPLLIHQGTTDDAVPFSWNDEFVGKVEAENLRRAELTEDEGALPKINFEYFRYSGADHNLQPAGNWNTAIQRDLEFFKEN